MPLLKVDRQENPNWEPPNGWERPDDIDRKYYKRLGAWRALGYELKPGQEPAKWALSWGNVSYVAYFHRDQVEKKNWPDGQILSESVE